MVSLTVQQRDLLKYLLNIDNPITVADIGTQLNLTPRQVNYRLKTIKVWLEQRNVILSTMPGVGTKVDCAPGQCETLLDELNVRSEFELVLGADARQQLLVLSLLVADEPAISQKLCSLTAISRTTLLKDLDIVEPWLKGFDLALVRRPNYGVSIEGRELDRRQALAALIWGDSPFGDPLSQVTYDEGIVFSLADAQACLPIVRESADFLRTWDVKTAFSWVAYAEDQMNGRFADNTVLHLALAFAIQARRVSQGYKYQCSMETLSWLESQQIWPIAISLAQNIWPEFENTDLSSEVAVIAMHLLAGLRSTKWPVELQVVPELTDLINELLLNVSQAFFEPELRFDTSLRDGLVGHIIPALMQQRFKLWSPPSWSNGTLAYKYRHEYKIACELAELVTSHTGMTLPLGEIETLTLLLRAAYIRERPVHQRKAFVVCPSGMATAQLLVARLRARFPNLEILGALSFRELASPQVKEAQLLITTTPINAPWPGIHVIKVHPLLLPENIEAITNWLTF